MYNLAISDQLAELLKQRAKAGGQSLLEYLESIAKQPPTNGTNGHRDNADWDANLKRVVESLQEWGKTLPPGHVVDDSRESIYE